MSYIKGKVKKVSLKPEREGQHGKFAPYGINLETPSGEMWVNGNAGADKHTGMITVKDSNYNEIKEGMEIECMYETNDKGYHNVDKKTLKITSGGGQQQNTQAPTNQQAKQPTKVDTTGIAVFLQCLEAAVATSKNITLVVEEGKEPVEFASDKIIRLAKFYYAEAIKQVKQ